jgi:PAS domain S-box-containing protein
MIDDKIAVYEDALARERELRKKTECLLEVKVQELLQKEQELRLSKLELAELHQQTTAERDGVFENMNDSYVIMDLDGYPIKMNTAAEQFLGFTAQDRMNLITVVHKDDVGHIPKAFQILHAKGVITNFKTRVLNAAGEIRQGQINASIIYDSNGKAIAAQGIVRDTTQEALFSSQLEQSQNRLAALILNMESAVLLEDENRDIVLTNKKFCAFFNIPSAPKQMVGINCKNAAEQSQHLFKDPIAFVTRINDLVSRKVQALGDEITMLDGRILERDFIPIFEKKIFKGFMWSYRDMTMRLNYRQSIEAQREKYSNIIANMNLGLIEVDTEDVILMVNQRMEVISGYTNVELIGKRAKDLLLVQEDTAIIEKEILRRKKGKSNSYEVRVRRKDGKIRHWLISGAPQYDINGTHRGSIGIHLDISEFKSLQVQKESLFKRLEQSNKELQEYAHVVSHDLKSPLRSISALVHWIKEDIQKEVTTETYSHLEMIDSTLEHMETLITNVLEYSSLGERPLVIEPVDLNELLQKVVSLLQVPPHITIKFKCSFPVLNIDGVKMKQLFQNLISNAVRYSDKSAGIIELDYALAKGNHTFSVKDNGIGIDAAYHEKIFEIFQSLSSHKESTGIGLSIVKKILDFYNGNIWVKSTLGSGSTFYFSFPKLP